MHLLLRTVVVAVIAASLVSAVGCGSSNPTNSRVGANIQAEAAKAVTVKATSVSKQVSDRYLKGPRKFRTQCSREDVRPATAGAHLRCKTTAYVRPQVAFDDPNSAYSVAVASENWIASIDAAGRVTGVEIGEDGYAISQFFQDDDANGCSVGKSTNC